MACERVSNAQRNTGYQSGACLVARTIARFWLVRVHTLVCFGIMQLLHTESHTSQPAGQGPDTPNKRLIGGLTVTNRLTQLVSYEPSRRSTSNTPEQKTNRGFNGNESLNAVSLIPASPLDKVQIPRTKHNSQHGGNDPLNAIALSITIPSWMLTTR